MTSVREESAARAKHETMRHLSRACMKKKNRNRRAPAERSHRVRHHRSAERRCTAVFRVVRDADVRRREIDASATVEWWSALERWVRSCGSLGAFPPARGRCSAPHTPTARRPPHAGRTAPAGTSLARRGALCASRCRCCCSIVAAARHAQKAFCTVSPISSATSACVGVVCRARYSSARSCCASAHALRRRFETRAHTPTVARHPTTRTPCPPPAGLRRTAWPPSRWSRTS